MITSLLLIIHGFIYISFIRFVPVLQAATNRRILVTVLILLGLSFPVFTILNHFIGNAFTRMLNAISGLWFALAIYLVMVFILLWLVQFILPLGKISADEIRNILEKLALGGAGAALLFTFYGLLNALTVKTALVDVGIRNLPEYWQGKTIMQISDVHTGGVWGKHRIKQITKIAINSKPDLIVFTGDLFDGASGKHSEFIPVLKELAQTNPPDGIFFTSGNHERYSSYVDSVETVKKAGIRILENDVVQLHGIQLIGVQYPDLRAPASAKTNAFNIQDHPEYKKGRPSILLYHTPTDFMDGNFDLGDIQRKAYINPETNFENAQKLGIDLQLSGHTHAGQFSPFLYITKKIYHGFHYGLHRVGDFQIYISSGAGTWGPPIRHGIPNEVALLKLLRSAATTSM